MRNTLIPSLRRGGASAALALAALLTAPPSGVAQPSIPISALVTQGLTNGPLPPGEGTGPTGGVWVVGRVP